MTTPYPPPAADEQRPDDGRADQRRLVGVIVAVVVTLGIVALALTLVSAARPGRPLFPALPSPTPPDRLITSDVETVAFAELNDDPAAFLNQVIEVTGEYTPLELADCRPQSGPIIAWSLVADSLQLNATGFERVLRLVEPGTVMTVVGEWRLYDGPVGCGKQPPDGVVWYLAVTRIIAPNPLFGGPEAALTFVPGELTSPTLLTPPAQTLELTPTAERTPGTPESTPVTTPGLIATPLPTATGLAVTPLPTLPGGATTPLPPTPGTPPPGSTASPTVDPNATPTAGSGTGGTPGIPTATPRPDGYPGQPTQPPGGYP